MSTLINSFPFSDKKLSLNIDLQKYGKGFCLVISHIDNINKTGIIVVEAIEDYLIDGDQICFHLDEDAPGIYYLSTKHRGVCRFSLKILNELIEGQKKLEKTEMHNIRCLYLSKASGFGLWGTKKKTLFEEQGYSDPSRYNFPGDIIREKVWQWFFRNPQEVTAEETFIVNALKKVIDDVVKWMKTTRLAKA